MTVRKVKIKGGKEALAADLPGGYTKVLTKEGDHIILAPEKKAVPAFPVTKLKK